MSIEQLKSARAVARREDRVSDLREGRKLRAIKIRPRKGKGSYNRKEKYPA